MMGNRMKKREIITKILQSSKDNCPCADIPCPDCPIYPCNGTDNAKNLAAQWLEDHPKKDLSLEIAELRSWIEALEMKNK